MVGNRTLQEEQVLVSVLNFSFFFFIGPLDRCFSAALRGKPNHEYHSLLDQTEIIDENCLTRFM